MTEVRIPDRTVRERALTAVIGIGSAVAAAGGALVGGALGWCLGGFFACAAALCLYEALRPVRLLLGVSADGITVLGSLIPWSAIEAVGREEGAPDHEGDAPAPFVWIRVRADHAVAAEVVRWNRRSADPLVVPIDYAPTVSDAELLAALERHGE